MLKLVSLVLALLVWLLVNRKIEHDEQMAPKAIPVQANEL